MHATIRSDAKMGFCTHTLTHTYRVRILEESREGRASAVSGSVCTCVCVCVRVCINACMHVRMYARMKTPFVPVHACMHAYINACMYVGTGIKERTIFAVAYLCSPAPPPCPPIPPFLSLKHTRLCIISPCVQVYALSLCLTRSRPTQTNTPTHPQTHTL